jgi:hypothetical protein
MSVRYLANIVVEEDDESNVTLIIECQGNRTARMPIPATAFDETATVHPEHSTAGKTETPAPEGGETVDPEPVSPAARRAKAAPAA